MKKIVGALALVLVAYFILSQPASASSMASNLTESLQTAADNILSFFTSLVA